MSILMTGDTVVSRESIHGLTQGEEYVIVARERDYVTVQDAAGHLFGDARKELEIEDHPEPLPSILASRFRRKA